MSDVKAENVQTWAELLRSFEGAKGHFAEAYRHALLGVAETVRVVQTMAGEQAGENAQPITSALELLRKGLLVWADRIPALLEAVVFERGLARQGWAQVFDRLGEHLVVAAQEGGTRWHR